MTYKTWNIDNYFIQETNFDYDLHKFIIRNIATNEAIIVVPSCLEEQEYFRNNFNKGILTTTWEDGFGNTLHIEL